MFLLKTLISSRWFWYGLVVVAILASVGGAYAYVGSLNNRIEGLVAENTTLQTGIKTATEAYEAEARERAKVNAVLGSRERDLSKLRATYDRLKHRINLLETENPDVKIWMDSPLPDALVDELREGGNG